jgi:hypothetical protein
MSKPMRSAGITKEALFAEMEASGDPKILAMIPKLRAVKGWSIDDLFVTLCEMTGRDPKEQLK